MITLTAPQKLYAAALAIGALGFWQARRMRNSLVGVCVSGATGSTACGGDVPVEGNHSSLGGAVDSIVGLFGGWWSGIPSTGNTGQMDASHTAPVGSLGQSDDRPTITWGSQGPNTEDSWP